MVCVHTHTYLDVPWWYLCFYLFIFISFFHIIFLAKFNQRNRKNSRIYTTTKKIPKNSQFICRKKWNFAKKKTKKNTALFHHLASLVGWVILPLGGNWFDWGALSQSVTSCSPPSIHKAMVCILHHGSFLQVKLTTLELEGAGGLPVPPSKMVEKASK
jgi:hypothetical protein